MTVLYDWLRKIIYYFIFMTAVLNCIPNSSSRRYVRSFLAMLLMLVLCRPVFEIFSIREKISEHYQEAAFQEELREIEQSAKLMQGLQGEYLLESYEQELCRQIRQLAKDYGLLAEKISVKLKADGEQVALQKIELSPVLLEQQSIYREKAQEQRQKLNRAATLFKQELMELYALSEEQIVFLT